MKDLIVYYSLTGTNEKAAFILKDIFGCRAEKIVEAKNRRGFFMFFRNGYEAITRKLTDINELKEDLANYDRVILLTPVWAGNLPPAARTFLSRYGSQLKSLDVVSVCGFGEKNKRIISEIRKLVDVMPQRVLFIDMNIVNAGNEEKILREFFIK